MGCVPHRVCSLGLHIIAKCEPACRTIRAVLAKGRVLYVHARVYDTYGDIFARQAQLLGLIHLQDASTGFKQCMCTLGDRCWAR
jgi:hypothetical protein